MDTFTLTILWMALNIFSIHYKAPDDHLIIRHLLL